MKCNHYESEQVKKNDHTHYGKQNYLCHECNRQFVENGRNWFVNESDKLLINKLLLERISLAGICRVCDISEKWLLSYTKVLYDALPDDLNADLVLPDLEAYLADRMDEEISRLAGIKKIQLHYRTIFSQQQLRKAQKSWTTTPTQPKRKLMQLI